MLPITLQMSHVEVIWLLNWPSNEALLCWGGGWHKKWSKTAFFAKSPSPRKFFGENFFMGSTMRKSTDSAFRICGSHRGTYDQKYSYCSSKSGQVGKSGFVPENRGCHKKMMGPQFWQFFPLFQCSHLILAHNASNEPCASPLASKLSE